MYESGLTVVGKPVVNPPRRQNGRDELPKYLRTVVMTETNRLKTVMNRRQPPQVPPSVRCRVGISPSSPAGPAA